MQRVTEGELLVVKSLTLTRVRFTHRADEFIFLSQLLLGRLQPPVNTDTVRTMRGRPLPNTSNNSTCVFNFFDQHFQSTKTPVFVRQQLNNRFAPYLLFSRNQVLIPLTDVWVLTDVTIMSSTAKNLKQIDGLFLKIIISIHSPINAEIFVQIG